MEFITAPDSFFKGVKEEYLQYERGGLYACDMDSAFYVYAITTPHRVFTGICAAVAVKDYQDGSIKKHEQTLAEKEQIQLNLLLRNQALVKPILLTYAPVPLIHDALIEITKNETPFLVTALENGNELHQFWKVIDVNKIHFFQKAFEEFVSVCYIADGHHRCSATALLRERMQHQPSGEKYTSMYGAFFDSKEVQISEFNRIIMGTNGLDPSYFMARLSAICSIQPLTVNEPPVQFGEFTLYIRKHKYRCRWTNTILEKYPDMPDTHILNEVIFKDLFGIQDIRKSQLIQYFPGQENPENFLQTLQIHPEAIGFQLYPVALDDFMDLADKGHMLPPKSTWFQPRLRNGILVYNYKNQ